MEQNDLDLLSGDLTFEQMRKPFKFRYSNDDPFFYDVDVQREIEQVAYGPKNQARHAIHSAVYDEALLQNRQYTEEIPCSFSGCRQICRSLREYEHHYKVAHMHTCNQCRTSFASQRLLDIHIGERHDSYFESLSAKKPMYACIVEGCDRHLWNDDSRSQHLAAAHGYPKGFKMHKKKYKRRNSNKPRTQICRFFNTPTGCKYGDKCKFQHKEERTSGDVEMDEEEELAQGIANVHIPDSISFGRRGGRGRGRGRGSKHRHLHAQSHRKNSPVDVSMGDSTKDGDTVLS